MLAWLPFLSRPLSSDEGGFLMVAGQWHPGTSLYGNYWVDRPPLLIALFALAHAGGGAVALRVIGALCVTSSVVLAGWLGKIGAPRTPSAPPLCAAVAAVFLIAPGFGAPEVDGEILAVPFVLLSLCLALRASQLQVSRSARWWLAGGVAAMAAGLVKQSVLDGLVVGAVVVGRMILIDRRSGLRAGGWFAAGASSALAVAVAGAAAIGTSPTGLWTAVVSFRFRAAAVLGGSSGSPATGQRATQLVHELLVSGAPLLIALALWAVLRRHQSAEAAALRWPLVALLAWEGFGVAFGGSYWLHYLIGLVPGLILSTCVLTQHTWRLRALTGATIGYASVTAGIALGSLAGQGNTSSDAAVESYLREHALPNQTAVVAFGHPNILENVGLDSPYANLWSLPVKVRDPSLTDLTAVLASTDRPTWVVISGASLASWGVDTTTAQAALDAHYREVSIEDEYVVYRERAAAHPAS